MLGMWQSEVVKLACMVCGKVVKLACMVYGKVVSDVSTSKRLRVKMRSGAM